MISFHTASPEIVGFDLKNRPCYPGDEIIDAFGVKYTVGLEGRCANGPDGPLRDLSDLQGAELLLKEGDPRAVIKAPDVPEAVRTLHAYDEPSLGRKRPQKEPAKQDQEDGVAAPSAPRKPFGGRKNNSGLVRVGNITKAVGYNLGNGTAVLRDAGIEVVKDPATGAPCVRIQDKDAARELLASLVPPAGAVAIESDIVEITPEMRATLEDRTKTKKVAEVKREVQKRTKLTDASGAILPGVTISHDTIGDQIEERVVIDCPQVSLSDRGPAVDYEALKEQEAGVAVRGILAQFEDDALVAELRGRGWTVTCEKRIAL